MFRIRVGITLPSDEKLFTIALRPVGIAGNPRRLPRASRFAYTRHVPLPMKPLSQIAVAALAAWALPVSAADLQPLRASLTHHVSFDQDFAADFSKGDRVLYMTGGGLNGPAKETEAIKIEPGAGKFGGALHVIKK